MSLKIEIALSCYLVETSFSLRNESHFLWYPFKIQILLSCYLEEAIDEIKEEDAEGANEKLSRR